MNKPRLIDANEVLNIIRNGWSNHYSCKDMCDEINNIPTAYDIDKVAKDVREVASRIFNYCEEIDLHIPEEERTGYDMLPDIWKLSEIVEKGGAE